MPNTYTQNYYHAVFGTRERRPLIVEALEERIWAFLGGIVCDLGCTPVAINGMPDHVHMLIRYRADLAHSDMLRHIKTRSSKWINETIGTMRPFAWQGGYGGFTVSKSNVSAVAKYIANQKEHHRTMDFRTEFMEMLRRHDIEFCEQDVLV